MRQKIHYYRKYFSLIITSTTSDLLSRVYHTRQGKNTPICQSLPFFLRTQRLPRNAPYNKRQNTAVMVIPCLCFLRMALTYIVPVRYCMNRGSANGAPSGGAFLVDIPTEAVAEVRGPDELRLLIFPQPLDGALKNQNAAPASPPCFRRRRTGCGTQHPLRLACVSLAAAPTTPRCFRRWRRSSSLQSAPLLFESCTVLL